MKPLFFLTSIILLSACSKKNIGLNEEFSLKIGQSAFVSADNIVEIEYLDLYEESRCAPGVECIWEGRVAVVLKLNGEETDTLGLNHTDYPGMIEYLGKTIKLLGVSYKSDDDFGKKEKSSVQLIVE
jgi:hypothetical protein